MQRQRRQALDDFTSLLQLFVAGKLPAADFVTRYRLLWRDISDEQRYVFETYPKIKEANERLWLQRDFHLINDARFEQEAQKLFASVCRVAPGTKTDKIINHLMIEADAYVADAGERETYQLGEPELLVAARKALDALSSEPQA